MSGGQISLLFVLMAGGLLQAQDAPPVRGSGTATNSPSANSTGTATNNVVPEVVVPEVVGPELKPVEVVPKDPKDAEAMEAARAEARVKALGEFGVIPRKDPFRLIKPVKIEEPKVEEFIPVGAPKLQGISTLYNPPKAVLRMSPPGGGKAQSYFLGPEESKGGVEVMSVDIEASTVVVKVGEHTYDLKIEKPGSMASKSRPDTGSRFPAPPSSSGSKPSSSGRKPDGTKKPSRPSVRPGGLKPVPSRPSTSFNQATPEFELPAFNEAVQKLAVEPSQISTQREIIGGQLNYTPPTDFPEKLR